jgi:hypothetical protein
VVIDEISKIVHEFVLEEFQVKYNQIVLIGRSIGTGPTCSLASYLHLINKPPLAVILQSPFTSIRNAASDLLGCISFLMFDRWPNWMRLIGDDKSVIKCPVLFIHADNDIIIKCHHSIIMHEQRLKHNLPSELFIQKSTDKMIKGHNYFDYENDVIVPSRDFLMRFMYHPQIKASKLPPIVISREKLQLVQTIPPEFNMYNPSSSQSYGADSANSSILDINKKQSKCDRWVWAGWCCCPFVFCTEAWCSCGVHTVEKCSVYSGLYQPSFNYHQLKPRQSKQGSLYNLFVRKKGFERIISEEETQKTAKQTEVQNPLNAQRKSSESTRLQNDNNNDTYENYPSAIVLGVKNDTTNTNNNGVNSPSFIDNDSWDDVANQEKSLDYIPG